MARTPALSRDEAHYACMVAYGTRKDPKNGANITSENRGPIRAWLTACGVPSDIARGLTLTMLRDAWTDTSDGILNSLIAISKEPPVSNADLPWAQTLANRGERSAPPTIDHEPAPRAPLAIQAPTTGTAAARLAQALADMAAEQAAPLDAEAVRAIVADQLAALPPTLDAHDIERLIANAIAGLSVPSAMTVHNGTHTGTLPALRHHQTENLARLVGAGLHVYIAGPAGSGKTHAAYSVAEALGLAFYMTGAVSGPHELLGFRDATGTYRSTPFRDAYENGGVFLFDEIDGSDAAALLVVNSALANSRQAFPDGVIARHADFVCIACANTWGRGASAEYIGRSALDAATLDRFASLAWDYDHDLELALTLATAGDTRETRAWVDRVQNLRAAITAERVRLVVSPRASLNGARAIAAGFTFDRAEEAFIWRGLDSDTRARVLRKL